MGLNFLVIMSPKTKTKNLVPYWPHEHSDQFWSNPVFQSRFRRWCAHHPIRDSVHETVVTVRQHPIGDSGFNTTPTQNIAIHNEMQMAFCFYRKDDEHCQPMKRWRQKNKGNYRSKQRKFPLLLCATKSCQFMNMECTCRISSLVRTTVKRLSSIYSLPSRKNMGMRALQGCPSSICQTDRQHLPASHQFVCVSFQLHQTSRQ